MIESHPPNSSSVVQRILQKRREQHDTIIQDMFFGIIEINSIIEDEIPKLSVSLNDNLAELNSLIERTLAMIAVDDQVCSVIKPY